MIDIDAADERKPPIAVQHRDEPVQVAQPDRVVEAEFGAQRHAHLPVTGLADKRTRATLGPLGRLAIFGNCVRYLANLHGHEVRSSVVLRLNAQEPPPVEGDALALVCDGSDPTRHLVPRSLGFVLEGD